MRLLQNITELTETLRELPVRHDRFFLPACAAATAVFWLLVFVVSLAATNASSARMDFERQRLTKVTNLVAEIQSLKSVHVGELMSMSPMATVQLISRDLGLEKHLSSIRPTAIAGSQEGVQMVFESLDLGQLLDLFTNIHSRGGLSIQTCTLTHRLDSEGRADLQLILSR